MNLPTGDENDSRVLLGRLIERIDQTDNWATDWINYYNFRLEVGAKEMANLGSRVASLETHLRLTGPPGPEHHEAEKKRSMVHALIELLIELIKAAKEFVEAVASLKEVAIAIAIIVAAASVASHPEALKGLIDTYVASGREGHE
ncbi:hypothetical protein [Hyphomicrobium sp. 802]|uniref:hypothetical protein n=1 Tax=Hyphomicrobium sp. 802 TaxID=1112272 RepID=UPI00045E92AF|nr:hypothetical protein [Hyphomicrobium sp. 802]